MVRSHPHGDLVLLIGPDLGDQFAFTSNVTTLTLVKTAHKNVLIMNAFDTHNSTQGVVLALVHKITVMERNAGVNV